MAEFTLAQVSQEPPHPTVGQPGSGMTVLHPGRCSPWFNAIDDFWNFGEGWSANPLETQVGGVLSWPTGHPSVDDFQDTSGGWVTAGSFTSVRRRSGYFWPGTSPLPPENEAGWELYVPLELLQPNPPAREVVLVIGFHETDDLAVQTPAGYIRPYPYMGVGPAGLDLPAVPDMARIVSETAAGAFPYYVIAGYAMRRSGPRPYYHTLQRGWEFVRFAKQLLADTAHLPLGAEPVDVDAVVVAGGSHGAGVAMLAPVLFPDDFHGGVGFAHPPDFSLGVMTPEVATYAAALLGSDGYGAAGPYDVMAIAFFRKLLGLTPHGVSLPARVALHRSATSTQHYIQRPLYLVAADEDPTTTGEDWLPIMTGQSSNADAGTVAIPNSIDPTVSFSWSISDKNCHEWFDVGAANPQRGYRVPGASVLSTDWHDAIHFLIPRALASAQAVPDAPEPTHPTTQPIDLSPYRHAFQEHIAADATAASPGGSMPGLLVDAPGWTRHGAGTRLGEGEALKVYRDQIGALAGIFVGSADGVVTRYAVNPTTEELDVVWQSKDLGYGAWALDVGELSDGQHVVAVATWSRVHLLHAGNGALLTPASYDLGDGNGFHPTRLQLVDLTGDGTKEIVVSSYGGSLRVLGYSVGSFQLLARFDEPGILDFVVGPSRAGLSQFTKPVYFISTRGHVFCVDLRPLGSVPQAYLLAASVGETGNARDVELLPDDRLIVTYVNTGGSGDTWANRIYEPVNLERVANFGQYIPPAMPPEGYVGPPSGGQHIERATFGGTGVYVLLNGNILRVYGGGGELQGEKNLESFAPATLPIALEVGDIQGSAGHEVVLATQTGRVIWFRMNELKTSGPDIPIPVITGFEHSNRSLAATWGMTTVQPPSGPRELHVVDQTGTHFQVDPLTGIPTRLHEYIVPELQIPLWPNPLPPKRFTAPIRDLSYVGSVQAALAPCTAIANRPGDFLVTKSVLSLRYLNFPVDLPSPSLIQQGFFLCPAGGDSSTRGSTSYLYYWNAYSTAEGWPWRHNLVVGARIFPGAQNQATLESLWDSADPGWDPQPRIHLRNNLSGPGTLEYGGLQSLRIGRIRSSDPESDPDVILSTVGGSVILFGDALSTASSSITESEDRGWGGLALAVGDLDADGTDEVVHGVLQSPSPIAGGPPGSTFAILDGPNLTLASRPPQSSQIAPVPVVTQGGPGALGVCGLTIADVSAAHAGPELLLGTLDGYLMVFAVSPSAGGFDLELLYRRGFEGSIGACNSMLVADLVNKSTSPASLGQDGKPEIYVAGSFGLRRLDVT